MIGPAYHRSDKLTWLLQKRHRLITGACAFAATAAVLFGIFQLAFHELIGQLPLSVPALEVLRAVIALILVVIATFVALQWHWMVGSTGPCDSGWPSSAS